MTIKTCTDCNGNFNPSEEGIVGGKVAFCGECCLREDADETIECVACGENVVHVDTQNGWCDGCHMDYAAEMDRMDKMANGCPAMEA